jgi:hypothetical protein
VAIFELLFTHVRLPDIHMDYGDARHRNDQKLFLRTCLKTFEGPRAEASHYLTPSSSRVTRFWQRFGRSGREDLVVG